MNKFSFIALLAMMAFTPQIHAEQTLTLTAPKGATVFVGSKVKHYVPFTAVEPTSVNTEGENDVYTFALVENKDYNYRVNLEGKMTTAAKFKMPNAAHEITISDADMPGDPKTIDRDPMSNNKYNVADIFLNADYTGCVNLSTGDSFQIVNLRNWEIVDGVTSNYFIEPDYHYSVYNESGSLSTDVVEVSDDGVITAKAAGTAIVLVTYDALNAPAQIGGPVFSAIWPENTGVIVVTVDAASTDAVPNTLLNASLNTNNDHKLSGSNIDAELDVIYFTGENGKYTFFPENAKEVRAANSSITSENAMKFGRFLPSNATKNEDGSYTVKLVDGKTIIRTKGNSGGYAYQVVRAKKISYTVVNTTNEGAAPAPGDVIKVIFDGVYHPCNKLAGVYNMSAKIQYTGSNGATFTSKQNQYQFAATETAKTVTVTIPADWDETELFVISGGCLVASGYGDPYGGHRGITYEVGKDPNFTAVQHTAYFGSLPDITIFTPAAPAAEVATFEELTLEPESEWSGDEEGDEWYYGLGYTQRFTSGGFSFINDCMPDYNSWIGFAYSNKTATNYSGLSDQFNSCVGHGYNGSSNYCVAYPDGTSWGELLDIQVVGTPRVVPGFYITNTAWVVDAILNGDNMTDGVFGVGDFFKVTIAALDAEGVVTATRDFCLADYRFENPADRYYINDWEYVDLSQLGVASAFKFTFDGSRKNAYGVTTPGYFCIDNFGDTGTENVREEGNYLGESSGIEDVTIDSESNPAIYNLQGIRVNDISRPGIYIVGGKKVIKR